MTITGTSGPNNITATNSPDNIAASANRDVVNGKGGPDRIFGDGGNDALARGEVPQEVRLGDRHRCHNRREGHQVPYGGQLGRVFLWKAGGRSPRKLGGLQAQRGSQADQGARLPPADTPLRERGR